MGGLPILHDTGTNVSVLFIDKSNQNGDVMLLDALKLGTKIKEGKNQRTVLSEEEIFDIENSFINQNEKDNFSIKATYKQIEEKSYSFSAGEYFEIKIEYSEMTADEYNAKMMIHTNRLEKLFDKGNELELAIIDHLVDLRYE